MAQVPLQPFHVCGSKIIKLHHPRRVVEYAETVALCSFKNFSASRAMAWVYYAHIAGIAALGWLEKQCAMGFPVIHSVSTKLPKIMKYFAATGNAKEAIVKNLDELDAVAAEIAHAATVTYTIQPGDTLSQLAITFRTSVAAIAAANGIGDVNKIRAGTTLTMPG